MLSEVLSGEKGNVQHRYHEMRAAKFGRGFTNGIGTTPTGIERAPQNSRARQIVCRSLALENENEDMENDSLSQFETVNSEGTLSLVKEADE